MATKINSSKLLPQSKSSSLIRISTSIKEKRTNLVSSISRDLVKDGGIKDTKDANNKLVKIEKFFKSDLILSKKKAEVKRKEKEKQNFEEAEKKLETPKSKEFKVPGAATASIGFLDRVKRFLFFTSLGWILPKVIEFLPKLEGFVKIIGGVYQFAEGMFGKLFDGFMSLVKFGGDLKDKTIGFIAQAKAGVSGNYQTEFDRLEKQFNTFVDASIIAGLLSVDIGLSAVDEYNKQRRKAQKPIRPGKPIKPGRPIKPGKPKITYGHDTKPAKPPSWWNKIFKGPFAKLKGPLSKFAGAAVPGLGAAVGAADAKARFAMGDAVGGVLASVSAALDVATAAAALTGIGLPVAGVLGTVSIGIDVVLLIRDIVKTFFPFVPMFSRGGRVVRRYQGGGTTRGGKPVGAPKRRTFTPTKRRLIKVKPPKSQPGKDVGGEKQIKKLYPERGKRFITNEEYQNSGLKEDYGITYQQYLVAERKKEGNRPSSYNALTTTAKILKDIPLVGGIMGAAVDIALGQKPDPRVYRSISSGITYLVETLANQRVGLSISSLVRDIQGFADGGYVTPSRSMKQSFDLLGSGDLISKIIGPTIEQRVNEAIQSIQKELQKRGERGAEETPDDLYMRPGSIKVTSDSPDFWLLVTAALFENGQSTDGYQGAADVAQAIYNRVSLPGWPKTIRKVILAPGQFQPVAQYGGSGEWSKINSKEAAIAFAKKYKGYSGDIVERVAGVLLDPSKQQRAREFVGPRDNFRNDTFEKGANHLDDATEATRYQHTFGFEPGGLNIGKFKSGQLMPAEINKQVVTGKVDIFDAPVTSGYKPPKPGLFNTIQYITGDSNYNSANYDPVGHGGDNYHEHVAFKTSEDKERAKKALRAAGFKIGSELRPGDPGYHGRGLAFDVPFYGQTRRYSDDREGEQRFSRDVRRVLGLESGGLVSPKKPNRSIPNRFASYETYGSGSMLAIQPVIVRQQVQSRPNSDQNNIIAFPIPISSGVNNIDEIFSSSRGY